MANNIKNKVNNFKYKSICFTRTNILQETKNCKITKREKC